MPTLAQLAEHGRTERVEWTGVRDVPKGFLADCLTEAARRIDAQEDQP